MLLLMRGIFNIHNGGGGGGGRKVWLENDERCGESMLNWKSYIYDQIERSCVALRTYEESLRRYERKNDVAANPYNENQVIKECSGLTAC